MFRGQIPEGVDPRTLMKLEPLRAEYQRPRRAHRRDGRAGPRRRRCCSRRSRCGIEQVLRDDIEATMASAPRVQPVARRGLGLRVPGPHLSRVPMLSLADPDAAIAELEWVLDRGARMVHLRPAPVPTANGKGRSFGHPDARPGVGRASPRPTCRSRSTSATAATRCSPGAWGGARLVRAVPRWRRRAQQARGVGPADPRQRSAAWSSTACSTATRSCAPRASRTAPTGSYLLVKRLLKQANQTPWVFPESPLDTMQAARVGDAVLRRGHAQARRPHRCGAGAVRLRLAAR